MAYSNISVNPTLTNATALRVQAWDKVLAMRAQPDDIFFKFGGQYDGKTKAIPNAIFLKAKEVNGAYSYTFPLLMPLSSDPGYGTGTDPISNAEQQVLKHFTCYYNDYDKSVKGTYAGIESIVGDYYKVLGEIEPQISQFLKEMFGMWVRYALINGVSPNLQSTPVGRPLKPNPNTVMKGLDLVEQPSELYTQTAVNFATIIAAQFTQIPSGTSGACDVSFLDFISDYFTYTKPILPLNVDGEDVLIVTVPTSQAIYLTNPTNSDGLGAIWQATNRTKDEKVQNFPGYLGRYRNLVLVVDPRAPIAKGYGSGSGSSTGSAANAIYIDKYYKPGSDDRGALGTTDIMEAMFVLGKGAVVDLEPESPHFEVESQYLNKLKIKGALGSRGFTRVSYDLDTPTSTSVVNQGSAVAWVRKQTTSA